ncbi:hypothetical protein SEA_ASHERTHEMAN_73 [Gordonia phage Ashertheman]|uniref:Uncharacterized protein n=3 Tax=Kroosvirus TaxID=2948789 RepID=A0A3G3M8G0_9CAUD|nr:hypothetical protein J1764_gp73 [Gordonia phage Ashertheman]YP_010001952.1 hypothetical protein J1765_gp74 [Gordonia phage Gaea]YP_010002038.1 hypothetical protein J1766_gp74 [Gordonia phage Bizzy]URP21140.1 hypothetical protein SEA_FLATWOODS_73 [Gordonia phage Flatwoods]WMI33081.1 hypothetical protein SEA_SCHOTTB_71 [Gordonia Phage SchottB]AXQ62980.1 hypothetical protein SEA_ASHERTHEMAN_73 [Gordonia phage Ashertheman]AYR02709.1 hypothetical protein SEA_BIZZY_74 [Gordonia phage Bizzy]AYR0
MKVVELTAVSAFGTKIGRIAIPLDKITAVVEEDDGDRECTTRVHMGAVQQGVKESYETVLSRIGAKR